jgi:hypothetical protein
MIPSRGSECRRCGGFAGAVSSIGRLPKYCQPCRVRPSREGLRCTRCGVLVVTSASRGRLPKYCEPCRCAIHREKVKQAQLVKPPLLPVVCETCGLRCSSHKSKICRSCTTRACKCACKCGNTMARGSRVCLACWRMHIKSSGRPSIKFWSRQNSARRQRLLQSVGASKCGRRSVGRWRVIGERDGGIGWLCGGSVDKTEPTSRKRGPTVDHVIPLNCGGTDEESNLRLAHRSCNSRRADRQHLVNFGREWT